MSATIRTRTRTRRSATAALLAAAAAAALALTGAVPASAAPGNPGVPGDPVEIFSEDFENGQTPAVIQRLDEYVGDSGMTYTAAQAWLEDCNGWISSALKAVDAAAQVADCNNAQLSWNQTQRLAYGLGVYAGSTEPASNHSVSAYTAGNPGANAVEFSTDDLIALSGTGRYLVFSVDVASLNCGVSAALMQFQVFDEEDATENLGPAVNACTIAGAQQVAVPQIGAAPAGDVVVATVYSPGSIFFTGSSVGISMTNANGSGTGNDHAFDNIRLLDATPQLDKAFADETRVTGESTILTFTITNTTDLAAKEGWSFSDTLPAGMTVAAAATTDCPEGIVGAVIGAGEITVSGDLDTGMASCTVSVPVTAATAGSYVNGPDNVTTTGLDAPAESTIVFEDPAPALAITKSADALADEFVAGQTITFNFEVENTGNIPVTDIIIDEVGFSGSDPLGGITCEAEVANLVPGDTVDCWVEYVATEEDVAAGSLSNTATATGGSSEGAVTSDPSTVTVLATPLPAIEVVKSADADTITRAGQVVTYTFTVTNTGNVAVADVTIVEGEFSGTGELSAIECGPEAALLPIGESVDCTATYAVTPADLEAGTLANTASAEAVAERGGPVEADSSTVEIAVVPALATTGATPILASLAAVLSLLLGALVITARRLHGAR